MYRARDAKLKREVALKILPDSFAGDPERMARFQREAEVLAALNHPNIAQIYPSKIARRSWSWSRANRSRARCLSGRRRTTQNRSRTRLRRRMRKVSFIAT